ncbi:MAG: hypothetical protein ACRDI0_08465 [Actinomycetota bacterium]
MRKEIQRLGQNFGPPDDAWEKVVERRRRRSRRRRWNVAVIALGLSMGTLGVLAYGLSGLGQSSQSGQARDLEAGEQVPVQCPAHEGPYASVVTPASAPPGSFALVSGKIPQGGPGEGGSAVGSITKVRVWWNLDPNAWWSALVETTPPTAATDGPVLLLGEEDVSGKCGYEISFKVPDVPPGTYPIVALYSGPDVGGPSTAMLEPATFTVE